MKIAQIVCVYPPYAGGIGTSAWQFAHNLSADHEITTFTPYHQQALPEKDVCRLKPIFKSGHGSILWQLLFRLKKFDVIYLHYPFFGTAEILWLFKVIFPKTPRLMIHYHMDTTELSLRAKILSWPTKAIRTSLLKKAEIITCASLDYIRHGQLKNFFYQNPEKFREIPFSVDLNYFRPLPHKTTSATKHLLFVGGLDKAHYFKGVDILLEAVARIKHLNWHLTIAGEGELKTTYINLAKRLDISERVSFIGKAENLPKVYQKSDFLILPSINNHEAFGLVLIEAMACGLPVIASNLPGVRSVFEHKKHGLLVEPENIEDLKAKIELLIKNQPLYHQLSQNAIELTKTKYSPQVWIKHMQEILKEI